MSFRWKTILGIGLIELVFLSLLIWQASSYLRESNEETILARARDTLMLASSVMTKSMIAYDLATLEEQAKQILKLEDVEYVRIKGFDRVLVSVGIDENSDRKLDDTLAEAEDGIFDQIHELIVADQVFGTLAIGMSVRGLKQTLTQAQLRFYGIALAELILVALCSWVFANYLTSKLNRLRRAAQALANGGFRKAITVKGDDELAEALIAFNTMAEALQDREKALKTMNGELVESNQQLIAREKELLDAKHIAERASLAKSRFLTHMSHEIRSPLNAVLGSLAVMNDRIQPNDPNDRFIRLALDSGESLLQVVNEVLDFSRIEAGHVSFYQHCFYIRRLLEEVQSAVGVHRNDTEVDVNLVVNEYVPDSIIADRDHLRQVLTILLDNARKYTGAGNVLIRVDVERVPMGSVTGLLTFEVRDTGPGIPPDQVDTVFLEFEQVDPARDSGLGGSGLGLAIARQLTEGMGGTIRIESEVSVGTSFFVTVPFSTSETPHSIDLETARTNDVSGTITKQDRHTVTQQKLSVLVVDDVEANLLIASEMLKSMGIEVHAARDGVEAVAMALISQYDIIFMDIRMPRLNGLEATRRIREGGGINAVTPIIALTANAERTEIRRCKEAGMDDFISKPFTQERLVQSIHQCTQVAGAIDMKQSASGKTAELLSATVLQQLARDTSGEAIPKMITVFQEEVRKRVSLINSVADDSDPSELREQAHALKSCAGTFGGLRLRELARLLEDAASAGNTQKLPVLIEELGIVAEQTLIEYAQYKADLGRAS
ncbi:response regulator [Marinobacter sp.]|uniref:response regulator n=1 Tax=Marinobacter sp. TaxID=50741 RepID=UPI003BAD3B37